MRKIIGLSIVSFFILGITATAFAMMCCQTVSKGTSKPAQAKTESKKSDLVEVGNKICPVAGEKIVNDKMKATYAYEGKIYNFCCAMCIDEFKKDPESYIKNLEKQGAEEKAY